MKAYLMFRDKDFNLEDPLPFGADTLVSDLELETLLAVMAQGDKVIYKVAKKALLGSLSSINEIRYRQSILADCIINPAAVRAIYAISIETLEQQRERFWWLSSKYISSIFSSSVGLLQMFMDMLAKLRKVADHNINEFESEGFIALLSMLQRELDDNYLRLANEHLNELQFNEGILISAQLGNYNQGIDYVLRRRQKKQFWRKWRFAPSFTIAPRDDQGSVH